MPFLYSKKAKIGELVVKTSRSRGKIFSQKGKISDGYFFRKYKNVKMFSKSNTINSKGERLRIQKV